MKITGMNLKKANKNNIKNFIDGSGFYEGTSEPIAICYEQYCKFLQMQSKISFLGFSRIYDALKKEKVETIAYRVLKSFKSKLDNYYLKDSIIYVGVHPLGCLIKEQIPELLEKKFIIKIEKTK